jgi:hypothetical protein
MHAEVQLDDEVRGYVDMVATIFVSICGGRKERPCSLPRSDSERTGRDREDGQKAGAFHGGSIRGTSHDRRNCAYCSGVFDLEDGDDEGHTLLQVSRGCHPLPTIPIPSISLPISPRVKIQTRMFRLVFRKSSMIPWYRLLASAFAKLFGVAKLVRFAHKSVEKVPIFIQGSVLP